ncbi:MAG: type II toxin-antitoxin system HicB family antitoxin [Defluviitaleaceae bacterium]|nr:type II toxin-antitoxin system HicB family antitoxin [Defluviitaleaceae bacterium]MCL2240806.1 type II toxin-antitoxin system HicB family antitoxin [Defluviitaleaceae bacterium]
MLMSNAPTIDHNNRMGNDYANTPIYTVVIHRNEDNIGFWAKCPMDNGCCFTDGDTIQETQRNMYESVSLYLQDDFPDVTDYFLNFVMADE